MTSVIASVGNRQALHYLPGLNTILNVQFFLLVCVKEPSFHGWGLLVHALKHRIPVALVCRSPRSYAMKTGGEVIADCPDNGA